MGARTPRLVEHHGMGPLVPLTLRSNRAHSVEPREKRAVGVTQVLVPELQCLSPGSTEMRCGRRWRRTPCGVHHLRYRVRCAAEYDHSAALQSDDRRNHDDRQRRQLHHH
jgi:hypothetical protein